MMEFINWKLIGKGGFCEVYKAQEKNTHEIYAIKVVKTANLNNQTFRFFETEKKVLRTVLEYNIKQVIRLINVMKDPITGIYYIVLEYCNGGTLHETLYKYINRFGKPFPEDLVRYLMKQILLGINCLHNLGIIHRDLKLANILLKYRNEFDKNNLNLYKSKIKIIDFNTSYFPNNSNPKTILGTIPNMAPSIINNAFGLNFQKPYDEKIDIWSLGTLCYEMLFGKSPFGLNQNIEMIQNIYYANFHIPNTISPQANSFLYCMLQKEGKDRLSCSQLLNHDFIKMNDIRNEINHNIPPIINNINNIVIKTNILFKDSYGNITVIRAKENTKIKDLMNLYFHKNNDNLNFINYNKSKIKFMINGENLQKMANRTIRDMNLMNNCIQVYYSDF